MSSVLFVEPVNFGSNPKIEDNAFILCKNISESQAAADQAKAFATLQNLHDTVGNEGLDACLIRLRHEPNGSVTYANNGDAIFPNNYISFHNFTDREGKITRRLVILYPMSLYRQGELAEEQILKKLEAASEAVPNLEVVDLRDFQDVGKFLEGTGALVFSASGAHVYMSRSGRTNDEVFDIICSEENLSIPTENRFLFHSALPRADGEGTDVVYHTNVIGWCGKGICAWGLDYMHFDSDEDKRRFYRHLDREYKCVLNLSASEINSFAGNAYELATRGPSGAEHRFLCMSETAQKNLHEKNLRQLEDWYGPQNIFAFPNETIERRTGGSIRCMMGASINHGEVLPSSTESPILRLLGIVDTPQ